MKKLSFAMALVMILALCASTLGVTAFAATYADTTVAVLSDGTTTTEYASLADALAAYKGGETLTIVKDIEIADPIIFDGTTSALADDMETMTTVMKDLLTIDGNSKTITYTGSGYAITGTSVDIVINNLTLKSAGSGIKFSGQSNAVLNDCNVLAAKTELNSHLTGDNDVAGVALMQDNNNKGYVEINGGVYKSAGSRIPKTDGTYNNDSYTSGTVIDVRYGRLVINDIECVGYYCNQAVQVGDAAVPEIGEEGVTSAGWINGGKYVLYNADMKKVNATCVRGYRGGLLTIYDGDFISYVSGSTKGSSVIGTHSKGGTYTYILGGKFYNLCTDANSMLMGHNSASNAVASMESAMYIYMFGGELYSTVVEGRTEVNVDGDTAVIRNKNDYDLVKATTSITDPYLNGLATDVNTWTYNYKYNATTAKADAKIKIQNGDKVYYSNSLWQAVNAIANDGATVTLLDNITLDKELVILARDAEITLDLNGKTITTADGVANAIRCQMGDIIIKNGTLSNANGSVFNFGYAPIDFGDNEFEDVKFANFDVDVTLNGVALTSEGDAYVTKCVKAGTLTFEGTCTVNGAAPAATTVDIAGMPGAEDDEPVGGDEGEGTTPDTDTTPDDGNTDASGDKEEDKDEEKKGGCLGSIGAGAVAVIAVAGLACGVVAKKRED